MTICGPISVWTPQADELKKTMMMSHEEQTLQKPDVSGRIDNHLYAIMAGDAGIKYMPYQDASSYINGISRSWNQLNGIM